MYGYSYEKKAEISKHLPKIFIQFSTIVHVEGVNTSVYFSFIITLLSTRLPIDSSTFEI